MKMPRKLPPRLERFRTRHGKVIWYVRAKHHGKRTRLVADYDTPAFWEKYRAALAGLALPVAREPVAANPGTLKWLVDLYRGSSAWQSKSLTTRRAQENVLKRTLTTGGDTELADLDKQAIIDGRERRKDTPHAANYYLKVMRGLFGWAVDNGIIETNPCDGVKAIKTDSRAPGFHTWTEEEVQRYEARWPLGTRERVALDVLLYTGLRRGDAVRLGRPHVRDGLISIRTEKTDEWVYLPILPPLAKTIEQGPVGDLTFIAGERGRPMKKESFGTWFAEACAKADVPGSAHGLRKAGAVRAAENGATEAHLNAMFGWREGSRESATYVRGANRAKLAKASIGMLMPVRAENKSAQTLKQGLGEIENIKAKSIAEK